MCGIAGYYGSKKIERYRIHNCLKTMKNRGPDSNGTKYFDYKNKSVGLLHSRLKIIDLFDRSNQPFTINGYSIIFNGEIYNFNEIKKNLISRGYKFKTKSDTEVLLYNFIEKKFKAFSDFEGMWALAIWDDNRKELILSRDRFGQKPLYYFWDSENFYFGSQINQIFALTKNVGVINEKKIYDYLGSGYRVLFKDRETFYKNVYNFPKSSYAIIKNKNFSIHKYWELKNHVDSKISFDDAKIELKSILKKSIENCLVSDQNISMMLSGGIDSNILYKIIHRDIKKKISTFSIIDKDKRYDESILIRKSLKRSNNEKKFIDSNYLMKFNMVENLKKKIEFYKSPMLTISSYVSSFLQKNISEKGIRVNLSGIGADELFGGYYQHHTYFLNDVKKKKNFNLHFNYWKKNIFQLTRNPHLRNSSFLKIKNYYRNSLLNYLVNPNIQNFFNRKYIYNFKEKKFSKSLLKNRMFNELFYENIPTMLFEDDRNHMFYSIENRSPFLDTKLVEFATKLPKEYLFNLGFGKYILRESYKKDIDKEIIFNKVKKGFNFNLSNLIHNKKNSHTLNFLLSDPKNPIFEIINFTKIKKIREKKFLLNSEAKFLFGVINLAIFLN